MAPLSFLLNPDSEKDKVEKDSEQSAERTTSASPVATHSRSPEFLHTQLPKYTPPERIRRPSSNAGGQRPSNLQQDTLSNAAVLEASGGQDILSEQSSRAAGGQMSNALDIDAAAPAQHAETGQDAIMAHGWEDEDKVVVKQEVEDREPRLSIHMNADQSANKNVNTLKQEHASRTQSPLRESSTALPTTEDQPQTSANMKKRPGPAKKKGTATAAKKPRAQAKKKGEKAKPKLGIRSFSPAPSDARSFSADVDEDDDESEADSDDDVEGSGDVYCICRKPDNGTFMIGCDGNCDDWFHGKCVGIEERDKHLMDKYICPSCTARDVGRTSWKRMCRRLGCRLPARVGRNAHKDGSTSKYCSDECGVLFFREMSARSRGKEQMKKARRKVQDEQQTAGEEDGNARGGQLSSGEVKAMLDISNTAVDFKSFGSGVLSPPPTPTQANGDAEVGLTEHELAALSDIDNKKDQARQRHACLKDRLTFIGFVKTEATRVATAKELKPKDYCGFDPRIAWSDEEFMTWRQSDAGQQAFQQASLEQLSNGISHDESETADEDMEVCSRKKCARHVDWSKLAVDEIRFEMTGNSDHMRSLEQDGEEVRQQAAMRSKDIVGDGSVEWHESAKNEDMPTGMEVAGVPAPTIPAILET